MPEIKLKKIYSFIVLLIFVIAIYIPFIESIVQSNVDSSSTEKRDLALLPEAPDSIKTLRRYPKKFNLYYQDNFGFRESFLWSNKLKYWIGDSPSEKVMLGKNGWLFYTGEPFTDLINASRGIRKFKYSELKQFAEVLEARYDWLKNKGIRYLFIIAPNKHSIYPEHMPDSMFQVNSNTMTDQLVDYIRLNTDVPVVDLRQALLNNKDTDTLLYYQTDTHWNHFGTNIAQYEITKILASYFPDQIKPVFYKRSDIKTQTGPGGDLSVMIDLKHHFKEKHTNPMLHPCTKRPAPPNGDYRSTFVTKCGRSSISALIFRDSFFEYLYQYLSMHFNKATFVSKRIKYSTIQKYIEKDKPDIVIEEWVERYLAAVPVLEPEFVQTKKIKEDERGKVVEER